MVWPPVLEFKSVKPLGDCPESCCAVPSIVNPSGLGLPLGLGSDIQRIVARTREVVLPKACSERQAARPPIIPVILERLVAPELRHSEQPPPRHDEIPVTQRGPRPEAHELLRGSVEATLSHGFASGVTVPDRPFA
jgi:hypothetical protein